MKIAILINTSWNIYYFRLGMLREFKADGHKVVCIAPRDDYSQKNWKRRGFGGITNILLTIRGQNPIGGILNLIYDYY